jgi:hypothetical protein
MRWLLRISAVVLVIVALVGGYCLYRGVSASFRAEHVLHAALLTVELLEDHITSHHGTWPQSWTDLEALPPRERGMFRWPHDSRDIQKYVAIDFSADVRQIAKQSIDDFDAVHPIGPHYPFKDYGSVESLIKTARAHLSEE